MRNLGLIALSFLTFSCASTAVKIPDDLKEFGQTYSMPFNQKKEQPLKIGPYTVDDLKLTRNEAPREKGWYQDTIDSEETFSFSLQDKEQNIKVNVSCHDTIRVYEHSSKGEKVEQSSSFGENQLECNMGTGQGLSNKDTEKGLKLAIRPLEQVGSITIDPLPFAEEVWNTIRMVPTGYSIVTEKGQRAAVSLKDEKKVYLQVQKQPSDVYLAAACAIVVVYHYFGYTYHGTSS